MTIPLSYIVILIFATTTVKLLDHVTVDAGLILTYLPLYTTNSHVSAVEDLTSTSTTMTDPLSPDSLHIILRNIIASDASTSTSSSSNSANDATLSNATSLIAALAHSIHTSLGFRQIRPKPQGEERESSVDPLIRNRLSSEWWKRCSEDESFEFQYRHDQSSLIFQIRISRLGGRTVVNAVAVEVSGHFSTILEPCAL